ncbi:4'-phosphopantetheinyl transferase family protein [Pedobacter sp. MR22-3]|uniref:4'-phosphopantetheinyl transferase family protein n=1 Tax=Pedobacter sp. MR22-3 TaxID=2994552 RepID=UPI002246E4B5|nr:4'-phosphopantetheinyl transferase superfamily protein [Pedobacter sp. MR22-3]MCX2584707.1 4'-phosphopantetheinyl transferase superfamily protein [Pedobacter sp. MR22-3]
MIVIKYCNVDLIRDVDISHYLKSLPLFMRDEILRYKHFPDQKSRLLSRLMLHESLSDTRARTCLGDWKRDINNRPLIDSWNTFNITHSSNIVVFAYSTTGLVGVDIERKTSINYEEIMEHLHSEEQQFIESASDPKSRFYEIWVKKEALLKAVGIGIVNGLNDFSCLKNAVDYQGKRWYLTELQIHPAYTCYLCSLSLDEEIVIQEFKIGLNL